MHKILPITLMLLTAVCLLPNCRADDGPLPLRGINLAGPGFANHVQPGKINFNYVFPSEADVKSYADLGMEIIRLSFSWERLQHVLNGPLDSDYLGNIDKVVTEAAKHNVIVLLDVHNYGSYRKMLIGSDDVPISAFQDMWYRLASHYKEQPNVAFGIMNEPHKHDAKTWANINQQAILSIRKSGAKQMIFIPGTFYSSASRWLKKDGELSNGDALKTIYDPANNFVFEAHTYFDHDSSGTNPTCPAGEDIGVKRIKKFTGWLRDNNFKGFLGEFGVSDDPTCLTVLDKTLAYMDENKDVWYGWSYWAASPWFGDYMFNVYPPDVDKFPQAKILKRYIDIKASAR